MAAGDTGAQHAVVRDIDIARRREQVAKLYLFQRLSMEEVAEQLGCGASTVCRDVAWLEDQAREHATADASKHMSQVDREFVRAASEAWKAYEVSKEKSKSGNGDPRFLAVVVTCAEKRAKLFRLGGFATDSGVLVGAQGQVHVYLPENGYTGRPQLPAAAAKTSEPIATSVPDPEQSKTVEVEAVAEVANDQGN